LSTPKTQKADVFFKPVKGVITKKFNFKNSSHGITIATTPNENVTSVLDGTVVFSAFTIEDGYVIVIEHNNEFTSVYKNNSSLLTSTGANVKAGESIALVGRTEKKSESNFLKFELWQKGKALNPEDYIIF